MLRPKIQSTKTGPEAKIQQEIISFLRMRGWLVKETHGNMFQSGFPDLYCSHPKYGMRWIEVKNQESYSFTPAQLIDFPLLSAHGTSIWILVAASEEEYAKLWKPANWYVYLVNLNHRRCK